MRGYIVATPSDSTYALSFSSPTIDINIVEMRSKYYMVPPWCQNNPDFTGRIDLLKTLRNKLCDDKCKTYKHRIALFGMGGVGKTQMAIEYVVANKDEYDAVFWITAANVSGLLLGFQEMARLTKSANPESDNPTSVAKAVVQWLSKGSGWLLVLDNLDDITVVKDYLPDTTAGGHTLITTRNPNTRNIPAEGLQVELLSHEDAIELLLAKANVELVDDRTRSEASQIVHELGRLPLAIEQAGAYIREHLKNIFA